MTYLDPLRLTFSGRFQAAPSTVNNDPVHFDNATFKPAYKTMQDGQDWNGWWNPGGDAAFRFVDCKVRAVHGVDGDTESLALSVCDSGDRVSGKIVDLDPEQQMVSELWGLTVRVCDPDGQALVTGHFDVAAFSDIWMGRAPGGGGDAGGSAPYQSVLDQLAWAPEARLTPFLRRLKQESPDLLSIKFVIDGYGMDATKAGFTYGRIIGAIGPADAEEPRRFTLGRQVLPQFDSNGNPLGGLGFAIGMIDEANDTLLLDLSNALATTTPGGPPTDVGRLEVSGLKTVNGQPTVVPIGEVNYLDPAFLEQEAGIAEVPLGGQASLLDGSPLILRAGSKPYVMESAGGYYVRADHFVARVQPDEDAHFTLYATLYGSRLPHASIAAWFDPSELQQFTAVPGREPPPVGTPHAAVTFPHHIRTDEQGVATFTVRASDPGNPRGYMDGQVYGIRYLLHASMEAVQLSLNAVDPWNFLSLLVWNGYTVPDRPTWHRDVEPILTQYANLYPIMDGLLDLGDYDSVVAKRELLLLAFGLDLADPNYMPVTRDLSTNKNEMILRWLRHLGPDGKPLRGNAEDGAAISAHEAAAVPSSTHDAGPPDPLRGGKTLAYARRLARRSIILPRD